jgi:hypothetical protein
VSHSLALRWLYNQHLAGAPFEHPADVVRYQGAVQSQDYPSACWALALRLQDPSHAEIERAFNEGDILRTHVLRPTWHFVVPEDIRWMLALTAPHIHRLSALYYRRTRLDTQLFARSEDVMARALQGGKFLTRDELRAELERAGIDPRLDLRATYIMMHAELEGVICSGPRKGKQFTYALLAERAPQAKTLPREEALAELARRYFTSHGPATPQDFAWWSGLTLADARLGLESIRAGLVEERFDGVAYWSPAVSLDGRPPQAAYLIPNYDEFGSHAERSAVLDADLEPRVAYGHILLVGGRAVGTWRRILSRGKVRIETSYFKPPSEEDRQAVAAAARRLAEFLGLELEIP